jgi:hypothetical protein
MKLDANELRFLLREHSLILEPGEVLVVMVPPDWSPTWCRDLHDALNAVLWDYGFAAVVTPGTCRPRRERPAQSAERLPPSSPARRSLSEPWSPLSGT